jgi:O-methyltransferase
VKTFVWGTGCPVSGLVGRYLAPEDVTAFVDNDASKAEFMGRPVISPAELAGRGADLIVVANRHGAEIAEQCEKLGIDPAKLFYMYDNYYLADRNADYAAAERALGRELTEKVRRSGRIIRSMDGEDVPGGDYVRLKTLSLAAAEIYAGGVPGAAAELGVYRGEFAAEINRLLPDRKLYLFDTFGGFGAAEAAAETEKNGCGQAFLRAHENTDVQRVLARLEKPENAVVMAGLFPESLDGLEERFAFVSLDVDFEESTCRGLEYFYPRLNPGGYLFLHDYNSPDLPGAKRAAARYERTSGERLRRVPLCDTGGTLVIAK